MRLLTASVLSFCAFNCSIAQDENPYKDIVGRDLPPIEIAESDDKIRTLLKQGYNATFAEVRTNFDRWRAGFTELDKLLNSLDRFQVYRVELEGEMDKFKFATQQLSFAKEIENQCAKGASKAKNEPARMMDDQRAISYRIAVELEIERFKDGESPSKRQ